MTRFMRACLAGVALLVSGAGTAAEERAITIDVKAELIRGSAQHGLFKADFRISNPNDFDVKDVKILCSSYGNSGTEIKGHSVTAFEIIPKKGAKIVKGLSLGFWPEQAKTASCFAWTLTAIR